MKRAKLGAYLLMLFVFKPLVVLASVQTIEVPPFATTLENVSLALSTATFDAILINGEPDNPIRMTVSHGSITLGADNGLVFTEGDGIEDARCSFDGTNEAINSALSRLIYTPPPNYAGRATLTIEADEQTAILQIAVNRPIDAETARDEILNNVRSIHGGGQPGFIVAYGRTAHDIAFYAGGPTDGTAVTAAGWGAGRVIALPDHQALNMHNYGQESGPFYRNAIGWLSRDGLDVQIVTLSADVAAWLQAQGYQNVVVANHDGLADALSRADIFIPPWLGANVNQRVLDTIGQFVRAGGGLLICDYGVGYDWWWRKPIYEAPGNILLREAGIGFVGGNRWEVGIVDLMRADGSIDAAQLIQMLDDPDAFNAADKERGGALLGKLYDALSPGDPLTQRLDAAFGDAVDSIRPTPAAPVTSAWEKALLTREAGLLRNRPANELSAHRSAEAIFGHISDDAPRIRRVITIDPTQTRWHSTGLYGAPGELITATIPADVQDADILLRFGGHTDNISVRDEWKRPPRVHWSWPLDSNEVVAASPYGGALYIDVGTENREREPFDVVLEGAVAAPQFVLGETSDEDWIDGIRDAPAPFAEMISEHTILSLPSRLVRNLDNPTAVMTFWNDVVRLQDELGSHGTRRYMAERINIDVQVSYGYLHAGYPTQGPTVSAENLMNLDNLRATGSWGWFHELGHEAQRRPDKSWGWDNAYTFDNSVEATVNIFTVYAYDQLGIREQGGWGWTGDATTVMKRALEGLEQGDYATIGVGFKLAFFLQLRDHFGWAATQEVFERYNDGERMLPVGNDAERNAWLIHVSEVVGHNLAPFMADIWGIGISAEARAAVAQLPEWIPAVGGLSGLYRTQPNTALNFDLEGEALSHDGVAEVVEVTQPARGRLVRAGDVWTYEPDQDITGEDSFTYGVRSSTGHVHHSTVRIDVTRQGVEMSSWYDIDGSTIADLRATPGFPDQPEDTQLLATLEAPRDRADRYGIKLSSYLVPEESAEYRFWLASDDAGELWLAPDAAIDNAVRIAHVDGWTPYRAYRHTPSQVSEPVALRAGRAYAIEALMKEGGGGDHLSVAWSMDDDEPTPIPDRMLFVQVPPQPDPDAGLPGSDAGTEGDTGLARDGALTDGSAEGDATVASDATIDSDAQRREDASLAPDDGVQTDAAPGTQTDTDTGAADANEPDATAGRDSSTEPAGANRSSSGCACASSGQDSFPVAFGLIMLVLLSLRMRTRACR